MPFLDPRSRAEESRRPQLRTKPDPPGPFFAAAMVGPGTFDSSSDPIAILVRRLFLVNSRLSASTAFLAYDDTEDQEFQSIDIDCRRIRW